MSVEAQLKPIANWSILDTSDPHGFRCPLKSWLLDPVSQGGNIKGIFVDYKTRLYIDSAKDGLMPYADYCEKHEVSFRISGDI